MSLLRVIFLFSILISVSCENSIAQETGTGKSSTAQGTIITKTLDPAILKVVETGKPVTSKYGPSSNSSETKPFLLFQLGDELFSENVSESHHPGFSMIAITDGDFELNVAVSIEGHLTPLNGLGASLNTSVFFGQTTGEGPSKTSVQNTGTLREMNFSVMAMAPDVSEAHGSIYDGKFTIIIRYN